MLLKVVNLFQTTKIKQIDGEIKFMTDTVTTDIVSLQFALFFRDIIERPDLEFADINSNLMNIFDSIPNIIPIPRELPNDIPIVTQRSESNEYVCNISRSRIDLHYNRINAEKTNVEVLADFNAKVNGLLNYLFSKRDFVRFGMICRYFHPCNLPTEVLKSKYIKESIGDLAEISLRYNKKQSAIGWQINDIVEISAAKVVVNNQEKDGVYVQRDINNDVILDKSLTKDELLKISKTYSRLITEKSIEELIK